MKIAVTGARHSLGLSICDKLSTEHSVIRLVDPISTYVDTIKEITQDCDVFINCGYYKRLQSDLFYKVYEEWKYHPKTIVNILTSALYFDGPNKDYINDKLHLEKLTKSLRTDDKKVRVINFYPNTLENTEVNLQKLKFEEVASLVKFTVELPQDLEIFNLGLSRTTTYLDSPLI